MVAQSAQWLDAEGNRPAGYLLSGVQLPEKIDSIPSVGLPSRPILMTRHDQGWLEPTQCYFATTVHPGLLLKNSSAKRLASIAELTRLVRNPAVHSSSGLHVLLHERIIRMPLDFALIMLGLPMVVNRRGRNLFVMIAVCMFTVLFFFALKTISGAMGGGGYILSPTMAAWIPLLVLGPIAYVRLRDVQLV
jgi:lipopolysaccharide export system permease protein